MPQPVKRAVLESEFRQQLPMAQRQARLLQKQQGQFGLLAGQGGVAGLASLTGTSQQAGLDRRRDRFRRSRLGPGWG